ncbi:MAG: cation:proton antiporter [Chloroflexi bacterium]|nr:cation:proton antiporter [Chloroflexota bacterium]
MGVAFLAPLALGLVPRLRLPAVVVEIVLGIVIGPDVLGWAEVDEPVRILSLVGLAFLLFLAGLELDLDRLRGRLLRVAGVGFLASVVLAVGAGFALDAAGLVRSPLLVAVILTATSLGLVIPVLKEGGHSESQLGQLILAGASIGDFAAVILLSLLFSRDSSDTSTKLVLLVGFALFVVVLLVSLTRHARSMPISKVLLRLQDTTAQIRVRGAMLLLVLMVVLAEQFGLETILGAFVAGALLGLVDRDANRTHPQFRVKLEALGYGFLIPVFFVASGIAFDLSALLDEPSTLARVPVFLAALLVVRGVPALVYRPLVGTRSSIAAGLLQATSLPFIVAATQIGITLDAVTPATAAAFVAAGLVSALLFPAAALGLLRRCEVTAPMPVPTGGPSR